MAFLTSAATSSRSRLGHSRKPAATAMMPPRVVRAARAAAIRHSPVSGAPVSTSSTTSGVSAAMNRPKLTARTDRASIASGNMAAAMASGVVQTRPTAAATTPPRAVPTIRSTARV